VGEQVPDGGPAGGRAQPGHVAVEAVEHLHVGELGAVGVDRGVDVEPALLHKLQRGHGDEHLGHRHDGELRVGADLARLARHPRPEAGLVEHAVGVRCDRRDVRHRTGVNGVPEYLVNRCAVHCPAHRSSLASSAG
jgi:hypothetical protein